MDLSLNDEIALEIALWWEKNVMDLHIWMQQKKVIQYIVTDVW